MYDLEKQARYDRAYLRLAKSWAMLSHCARKKVGAIIVKDKVIISDGYNGSPTGFPNQCEDIKGETMWYVLHAEANALRIYFGKQLKFDPRANRWYLLQKRFKKGKES
jgi:dCMP deaminase